MVLLAASKSCLKDSREVLKSEAMDEEEAKDLTLPKTEGTQVISSDSNSKIAQKRSVNFNLTIDFKKCDEFSVKSENNNCDGSKLQSPKSSISDFSDIESLCLPTTPGGRAQV